MKAAWPGQRGHHAVAESSKLRCSSHNQRLALPERRLEIVASELIMLFVQCGIITKELASSQTRCFPVAVYSLMSISVVTSAELDSTLQSLLNPANERQCA